MGRERQGGGGVREEEYSASHLYYSMAVRENGPLFNDLIFFSPW